MMHGAVLPIVVSLAAAIVQLEPRDGAPPAPVRPPATCIVTAIVDGDTIRCEDVGRVRLLGIDTPERDQRPFGSLSAKALASMLPIGSTAALELDIEERDQYGRVLAYVWFGSAMVNWRLVRHGWAVVLTYPPNVQWAEWLVDAQERARAEALGLWAVGGFACRPREHRRGRC